MMLFHNRDPFPNIFKTSFQPSILAPFVFSSLQFANLILSACLSHLITGLPPKPLFTPSLPHPPVPESHPADDDPDLRRIS